MTINAFPGPLDTTNPTIGWKHYFNMTKPTVTLLVVITAIPGVLLAGGDQLPPLTLVLAVLIGSGLSSASAAVFNQLVEKDSDKFMTRTNSRSLPEGKVTPFSAAVFATVLGTFGIGCLYVLATPLAAAVALAGHVFYVAIYTLILKRITVQNIVIGGAAGGVGPLIGWAAVTGDLALPAWAMFSLIFVWTPPHFWALALKYKEDYANAGIPMYPVVHGDHKTRRMIMVYSYLMLPTLILLHISSAAGWFFLVSGLLLTVKFVIDATKLYLSGTNDKAMPLFHYSCIYTLLVFTILAVERVFLII